ncbi:SCO family protein [Hymenobacter actinosclerus]|uniref:Protein SCO1/2 n=1 Tax=Hymenobacter actinosclerus TaxID=82805 RepID=A0A1I0FA62_9BACT|nr:SCO family protein [Hymenobacter actinosclerus]SET54394.1 protein SCO1/2 [Hymenobacter actinosclerus]
MKQLPLLAAAFLLLAGCNPSPEETGKAAPGPSVAAAPAQPVSGLSSESVYQLPDTFQTQNRQPFLLPELAGKPTVLAMVFTNCGYACPRLTDDMKAIETKLAASAGQVNYALVSFDVARDTAEQLKRYATEKNLGNNWVLLHGSDEAVRTLSVLLNVPYEKTEDGNFSHANKIIVLDQNGVPRFHQEGLGTNPEATISQINALLR